MRITDTLFPSNLTYESNQLQGQEFNLQNQIATGLSVINPSDNPTSFAQISQNRSDEAQTEQYISSNNTLQTTAQASYNGMSSLQTLVSNASEIITQANAPATTPNTRSTARNCKTSRMKSSAW